MNAAVGRQAQVSFIIPAFNAAHTLPPTLSCLQRQTVPNWEAIVVDDGSTDQTAKVARRWLEGESRVRFVSQENAGPSAARNRGLRHALADRIVFLDADDTIAPDYLEKLLPLGDAERRLAYCGYRMVLGEGLSTDSYCADLMDDPLAVLLRRCEPAIHALIVPKKLLCEVNGFDEGLRSCEDWDLWLRLTRAGAEYRGLNEVLATYVLRPNSLSTSVEELGRNAQVVMERAAQTKPCAGSLPDPFSADIFKILVNAHGQEQAQTAVQRDRQTELALATPCGSAEVEEFPDRSPEFPSRLEAIAGKESPSAEAYKFREAHLREGVFGRFSALEIVYPDMPKSINVPRGSDTMVVRLTVADQPDRHAYFYGAPTVCRSEIASAFLQNFSQKALLLQARAYLTPRFWLGAIQFALSEFIRAPRLSVSRRGYLIGHAARAGLRAYERLPPRGLATLHLAGFCTPILLLPPLTDGDADFLGDTLGQGEIDTMVALLENAGFRMGRTDQIALLRVDDGEGFVPPFSLVFSDLDSALRTGCLDRYEYADVLLTEAQIRAMIDRELAIPRRTGLRFGLRLASEHLPGSQLEEEGLQLLDWLRQINGDGGTVTALARQTGGDEELLRKCGFLPVLTASQAFVDASIPSEIQPALPCVSAHCACDLLETLRASWPLGANP